MGGGVEGTSETPLRASCGSATVEDRHAPAAGVAGRTLRRAVSMSFNFKISDALVQRYSAGPSQAKVDAAKSLRSSVESALGYGYDVFLQGSYRNNTGVADLNDLDVVALSTTTHTVESGVAKHPVSWNEIFARVERALDAHPRFHGHVSRGDKCVKVATPELALDVVPAIYRGDASTDPIAIYSFREGSRRDNYPRDHYSNGVLKNASNHTDGAFKPTVRLFKRWVRDSFDARVAPSFYVECAVHSVPDSTFSDSLPLSFAGVGAHLLDYKDTTVILSVAGDKDILVSTEWPWRNFQQFQVALAGAVRTALAAMKATTEPEANRLWRSIFGD